MFFEHDFECSKDVVYIKKTFNKLDVDDDDNMSLIEITDTSEQEQDSEDDQVKRLGKEITA